MQKVAVGVMAAVAVAAAVSVTAAVAAAAVAAAVAASSSSSSSSSHLWSSLADVCPCKLVRCWRVPSIARPRSSQRFAGMAVPNATACATRSIAGVQSEVMTFWRSDTFSSSETPF